MWLMVYMCIMTFACSLHNASVLCPQCQTSYTVRLALSLGYRDVGRYRMHGAECRCLHLISY